MVATRNMEYPDQELYNFVLKEMKMRNINRKTIGEAVYELQHQYFPKLKPEDFGKELPNVLKKREVLNLLATGFILDNLASEKKLPEPYQQIVENDLGQFGVDETLAIAVSQLYGSLGNTNFGYGDKIKVGWAKNLDTDTKQNRVNTFADDLFLALVSGVVGRFGHGRPLKIASEPEIE
ncbi:phosphatidylglycerophosphatase A [Liquorilactobacillus satsumensis]|uniref:phosphatidylglycerophosphatase A family protein n=1 Tax=Liquorilactobacillus satsumensis TaxID=259059 RepID=UPI0039E96353